MSFFSNFTKRFVAENKSAPEEAPAPKPAPAPPKEEPVEEVEEGTPPQIAPVEVPEDYDLELLLRTLVAQKGSDLHLSVGEKPIFRINGDLHRATCAPLT